MRDSYQWSVVGAGPAGIACVGQLLDHGVAAQEIQWIDPEFKVGDFGQKWSGVTSNTSVRLFDAFLKSTKAFALRDKLESFPLSHLNPADTCRLQYMAEPLQSVTEILQKNVPFTQDRVQSLALKEARWQLQLRSGKSMTAKNVILAIGAEAKALPWQKVESVPLEKVINDGCIEKYFTTEDVVAVVGSSHSAMIAVRHLCERPVKKVINFYLNPLRYAVHFGERGILFDDSGLKGPTAAWSKKHIDGRWPENLDRIYASPENIQAHLPQCNKVVYAVGFQRRHIEVQGYPQLNYHESLGILAPGLFGLGVAFPEKYRDSFGHEDYRVGLWKFMDYLKRVLPVWLKYPNND